MMKQKRKRVVMILTTTSLAGEMGLILDGIYAADKWAVTGMCKMFCRESKTLIIVDWIVGFM